MNWLIQAEDTSMEANFYLGYMYDMGLNGNINFEKAIKHYKKAIKTLKNP